MDREPVVISLSLPAPMWLVNSLSAFAETWLDDVTIEPGAVLAIGGYPRGLPGAVMQPVVNDQITNNVEQLGAVVLGFAPRGVAGPVNAASNPGEGDEGDCSPVDSPAGPAVSALGLRPGVATEVNAPIPRQGVEGYEAPVDAPASVASTTHLVAGVGPGPEAGRTASVDPGPGAGSPPAAGPSRSKRPTTPRPLSKVASAGSPPVPAAPPVHAPMLEVTDDDRAVLAREIMFCGRSETRLVMRCQSAHKWDPAKTIAVLAALEEVAPC